MEQGKRPAASAKPPFPRVPETDLARATFMQRLGAAFIDFLIVWIPVIVIVSLIFPAFHYADPYHNRLYNTIFICGFSVLLLYYWLFTALKGQTPGKRLFKIKVINTRGRRPGWARVLWRESVSRIALLLSLFVEGIFLIISNMTAYSLSHTTMIT